MNSVLNLILSMDKVLGERDTSPKLFGVVPIENKKPSKYYPTLKCIGKYKSKSRIKAAFENDQPFLLMGKVVTKSLLKGAGIPIVNVEFKDHFMVLEIS